MFLQESQPFDWSGVTIAFLLEKGAIPAIMLIIGWFLARKKNNSEVAKNLSEAEKNEAEADTKHAEIVKTLNGIISGLLTEAKGYLATIKEVRDDFDKIDEENDKLLKEIKRLRRLEEEYADELARMHEKERRDSIIKLDELILLMGKLIDQLVVDECTQDARMKAVVALNKLHDFRLIIDKKFEGPQHTSEI